MSGVGEESLTVNVFSAQAEDDIVAWYLLYSTRPLHGAQIPSVLELVKGL